MLPSALAHAADVRMVLAHRPGTFIEKPGDAMIIAGSWFILCSFMYAGAAAASSWSWPSAEVPPSGYQGIGAQD